MLRLETEFGSCRGPERHFIPEAEKYDDSRGKKKKKKKYTLNIKATFGHRFSLKLISRQHVRTGNYIYSRTHRGRHSNRADSQILFNLTSVLLDGAV